MGIKWLQKRATSAVCDQTRLNVTSESDLSQSHILPWFNTCETRGGFWFDILAHSCLPFGQWVCHDSFGGLEESPHPSGKTGNVTEVGDKPELKSKPPRVYKMSLSTKTSSHTQTCLNFRGALLWGDRIWHAYRKWECILDMASSHCEIVIHVGQKIA